MVRKIDGKGGVYHEPPYTWEEEQELYRRMGGGPITIVKGPPLEQRQKPQQPQPRAKRPT
jgi:hypothetical protein